MLNAPPGARAARVLLAVVVTAAVLSGAGAVPAPVSAAPVATSDSGSGTYVVLLSQPPAASYRGGIGALVRTAPRPATRYDASSPAARVYAAFLRRQQDRVAGSVGARPFYHYTTTLNGFAAPLTAAQARALSHRDGVLAVLPDRVRRVQEMSHPVTAGTAGATLARAAAPGPGGPTGADVVIGVVDSGIDSGSASFAPTGRRVPATYTGACTTGTDPDPEAAFGCSDKVVGGAFFAQGQGGPDAVWSGEYLSPEDYTGHGTRVASMAAGDARAGVTAGGADLGRVAGAAPDARVASYKVCWAGEEDTDSCLTSDALAGVDQAVADGVDVISYGIGGAPDDVADPVELAFLHAADAGVFVATVAGNGGPRPGTSEHPSPWVMTVGAARQDAHAAKLVLGNGQRYPGTSVTPDLAAAPLVLGRDAAAAGVDAAEAQRCFPGSLDPGIVKGSVVVCDRGTNDRVEKSVVVARAGGAGMVLLNPTPGSIDADLHAVPTVHLPETGYDGVYAYAEAADAATAGIRAVAGTGVSTPARAAFSGRGPSPVAGGDLLKPDLVAPGVDLVTASVPGRAAGATSGGYALSSGTSVAAGYVVGLAARLLQAHPRWSPMAVKSALMTTARTLTDTSQPFDQGAGFVRPAAALDPGLVLDSGLSDWRSFLAGQGYRDGSGATPVAASGLNAPSLVISELAGRRTVRRTVTNVGDATATYSVSTTGIEGISITAVPSVFTLRPGQRQALTLRIVRDSARLGSYQTGAVVLSDGPGGHRVRLPVALRPVGISAPEQVRVHGARQALSTRSGIQGTLTARVRGPAAAVDTEASGSDTRGTDFDPAMPGLWSQTVDVAGPREWLRVQTLPDDRADDLDLFLLDEERRVVASATSAGAVETVTVHGLAPGTYRIAVQPWFVARPSGETTFRVRTYQVPPQATSSLTVEPRQQGASPARANTWSLRAMRAQPRTPEFGWVGWYAGDALVGRTLVSSD